MPVIRFITLICLLLCLDSYAETISANNSYLYYKLKLTNLTKGQPIHHPLLVVHSPRFRLFKVGTRASNNLKQLAEDGNSQYLIRELRRHPQVYKTEIIDYVLHPAGHQIEHVFRAPRNSQITILAMVGITNDAFIAAQKLSLSSRKDRETKVKIYDAGTEENNERCYYIPAPPCNGRYRQAYGGEGIIHLHPGMHGQGDLDKKYYDFNGGAGALLEIVNYRPGYYRK